MRRRRRAPGAAASASPASRFVCGPRRDAVEADAEAEEEDDDEDEAEDEDAGGAVNATGSGRRGSSAVAAQREIRNSFVRGGK